MPRKAEHFRSLFSGAPVAGLSGAMRTPREKLHELIAQWRIASARAPRALAAAVVIFIVLAVGSVVGGASAYSSLRRGLPTEDAVRHISEMAVATTVFDDADRLAFTIYQEQRIEVPLSAISPNLLHAIVAIEDQRFYDHHGFDAVRIASAALANVRHLRAVQGGSTITQQLARQSFLTTEKTFRRKVQELILAAQIEQLFTKPQILEMYLN